MDYPSVAGLRDRLFWFDHNEYESQSNPTNTNQTSHSNFFEVQIVTSLVSHLIRQGNYQGEDIVVLTPYVRQLHEIRNLFAATAEIFTKISDRDMTELDKEGLLDSNVASQSSRKGNLRQAIRVATVDNFQGEEGNIIIISLVRNNADNNCGFLRTKNRINVLLSRAKHGMFIIGNSKTSRHISMWDQVLHILERKKKIGSSLSLCCPQHPETHIQVATPEDFQRKAPEGGCSRQCNFRRECGHACTYKCHTQERCASMPCMAPCPRRHKNCDHDCPKTCGLPCGNCKKPVKEVQLKCGHTQDEVLCFRTLDLNSVNCTAKVEVQGPCGHTFTVKCGTGSANTDYECGVRCGAILACGHECRSRCAVCRIQQNDGNLFVEHVKSNVLRNAANHALRVVRIARMGANIKAFAKWHVPFLVTFYPAAAAARNPFRVVISVQQSAARLDLLEYKTYSQIDLADDLCVFLKCGHIITVESMDGLMELSSYYELNADGRITGLRLPGPEPLSVKSKGCPQCRGSIRNITRYNRVEKRALLDEATKKFIVWSNAEFVPLTAMLKQQEEKLRDAEDIVMSTIRAVASPTPILIFTGGRDQQINTVRRLTGLSHRLGEFLRLRSQIQHFLQKVEPNEQPFARVRAMAEKSAREFGHTSSFNFDMSVLQTRASLWTSALLLRCDYDILSDILNVFQKHKPREEKLHPWLKAELSLDFSKNRHDCLHFAQEALQ
ncbi:uncharacterized protein KY384_006686 [Bacidia gigantensis]|uniref:uncharacterized protein n=1 Tax=Bacidia gigantensis TaxID=2732470 RepID=UPI001D03FA85|nr:uncharacterized protein KY384_006686 [Bacidia gigantensis]KAG8528997.1 hypothetical protein KY384_006686 [Bacidia gigantensis]